MPESHDKPCPACGYCPTCGRARTNGWIYPYPQQPPYWLPWYPGVTYGAAYQGGQTVNAVVN